jgi:hypothetical protein
MHGDADNDSDSDGADFLAWQRQMGSGVAGVASNVAVPEPSTLLLSLLGLVAVGISYRRRQTA